MRQTRKITVTASLEIDQLERLMTIAREERISRSTIVRDAVERELRRYEERRPKESATTRDRKGRVRSHTQP